MIKKRFDSICSKPILLEMTSKSLSKKNLKGTCIIACQHLLKCTEYLFDEFINSGLHPNNLFVIGKTYSTSLFVFNNLIKKGITVSSLSLNFDSHKPYDDQFEENIKIFIEENFDEKFLSKFRRIILLDDGGELIKAFGRKFKNFKNFIGVEQTSSGYEKLVSENLNFPVINVARSKVKLTKESPMIASGIIKRINIFLADKKLIPKKILVIGNGVIGQSLIDELRDAFSVSVYDINQHKSGIDVLENTLNEYDMIIGCTGKTVLANHHFEILKKDVILISASSSDREFNAVELRKQVKRTNNPHENLNINGIHLLNCGFPVNFFGDIFSSIPLEKIQLTLALLFAGVVQATNICLNEKGLVDLNHIYQRKIVNQFLALSDKRDLSAV